MVIKLKSMIHKLGHGIVTIAKKLNIVLVIYLLVSVASAVYSHRLLYGNRVYWSPGRTMSSMKIIYFIGGVACLIAIGIYLLEKRPFKESAGRKQWRVDDIPVEIIAAVGLAAGILWNRGVDSIIRRGRLIPGIWVDDGVTETLVVVTLFFPLILCFFGCIILLVRRGFFREIKTSSLIRKRMESYKAQLPFAKRMRTENRIAWIAVTVCALLIVAGSVWFLFFNGYFTPPVVIVVILIPILILYVVVANCFVKNRVYEDMDQMLIQIRAMADGELNASCISDQDSPLYEASQALHTISGNLQNIMEKQMRSERMKVDLITNVSHDLKTPLTSMIGYIDLLKKEQLSDEARDYVEVLALKQEQLKNMIQDIFDLSKATSGTVQMEMEELDMKKLLEQTLADMEDAVKASGMDIRMKCTEEKLLFTGDGKKLYRVLQNVLNNALKYSLKGTRIYIEAVRKKDTITVEVKNTSAYEMDFTPDEIMERFTRGDKSRNTEGHGLGLAIADSFTKNMRGEFAIHIDGDQFKVTMRFAAV